MKPLTALFAAGAGLTLLSQKEARQERNELREAIDDRENPDEIDVTVSDPTSELELEQSNALERLVDIKERNEPVPESRDASRSGTFTLDPGQPAVITVKPEQGWVLEVDRVYIDRRDDHDYDISVDGVDVSETHEWTGNPSRRVTENGKVIAQVFNDSSSTTTMDFVIDAYGIPSEVAP